MLKKNNDERKRRKELKQLEEIAEAFLKARSVYPPDYGGFLLTAGEKQVDLFYQTMHILTAKAATLGFAFDWLYDEAKKRWFYVFSETSRKVDWGEEACL